MKQLILAVLFGLVISIPTVTSQTSGFSQIGKPGQELLGGGYFIAHSSLPLNSKAKIVNTSTGKEVEVTVIRHIPASSTRIADISTSAWQSLELTPGTDIRIYTSASGRPLPRKPRPATPAPAAAAAPTPSEPVLQTPVTEIFETAYDTGYDDGYYDGYSITFQAAQPVVVHETKPARPAPAQPAAEAPRQPETQPSVSEIWAQVAKPAELKAPVAVVQETRPAQPAPAQPVPFVDPRQMGAPPTGAVFETRTQTTQTFVINDTGPQTAKPVVVIDNASQQAAMPAMPAMPAVVVDNSPQVSPPAPVVETLTQAAPSARSKEVVVTPGLPNPKNGKTYLLQVGSYATTDTAAKIARQLDSSGFKVAYESAGSMHRILVKDIPAAMVYDTAQSLGIFGIEEVWLRE